MRKLLNTLYVLSEDSYLSLDGENIVISCGDTERGRFPLHTFESIISFSRKGASPALMGKCAETNTGLTFFSPYGQFLARISGIVGGNVLLRREQYRIADDGTRSLPYARSMILGKVYNCRFSLERSLRDHPLRVDPDKLGEAVKTLGEGGTRIAGCASEDELRGVEGDLAAAYFSVFDELILNQKEDFTFASRSRRPPLDNVNALLSFAYAVLASECADALESVGLDPYVGFMHEIRPGRRSLALDLMEELRSPLADRFVLTLINLKTVRAEHFEHQKDGAVMLNDDGRRLFIKSWQDRKREQITHPFLKEKLEWGLVPYVQALLLARSVRGDLSGYPPFFWK